MADVVNTVNGGMAQCNLCMTRYDREWLVRMKVPGVDPERLKIEIRDREMFIYQLLSEQICGEVELPFLLTSFAMGPQIDFDGIAANYEDGEVLIHLPIDKLSDGKGREGEIIRP